MILAAKAIHPHLGTSAVALLGLRHYTVHRAPPKTGVFHDFAKFGLLLGESTISVIFSLKGA